MMSTSRNLLLLTSVTLVIGCSSPIASTPDAGAVDSGQPDSGLSDAGVPDGGADAGTGCSADAACPAGEICGSAGQCVAGCAPDHACASGMACVNSTCESPAIGAMSLVAVEGSVTTPSGPVTATALEAMTSFHKAVTHDYDDRQQGLGCIADYYNASTKPAPQDGDAGWLRMSGFVGGALLAGGEAQQPIVCMPSGGYYVCQYPNNTVVSDAAFTAGTDPLGSGSILFAVAGGADFGPVTLSAKAGGTVAISEDLTSIHYSTTQDTVLHPSCSDGCTSARIAVSVTSFAQASASAGWHYPAVGVVRCELAPGATVTVPHAAIQAMFASDASLDTVRTAVVRLAATPTSTSDRSGNPFSVDVGRGVFGLAPR